MYEYLYPVCPEEACNLARELQSVYFAAGGSEGWKVIQPIEYIINLKSLKELNFVEYTAGRGGRIGAAVPFASWKKCSVFKAPYPQFYELIRGYGLDDKLREGTMGGKIVCRDPKILRILEMYHAKLKIQDADHWYRVDIREFVDSYNKNGLQSDEIITEIIL